MRFVKVFVILLILVSVFIVPEEKIWAHEFKSDGEIRVLLHMEPEDSPIVKEAAKLYFVLHHQGEHMDISECECVVTIASGDRKLFEGSPVHAEEGYGTGSGLVNFTFPKKGIYTASINGKPKGKVEFDPFTIPFDVRIERESLNEKPIDPTSRKTTQEFIQEYLPYLIGGCAVIFAGGILYVGFRKPKKIKKSKARK